jgi:hypothetical protein
MNRRRLIGWATRSTKSREGIGYLATENTEFDEIVLGAKSPQGDKLAVVIAANPPKRTSFAEEDKFFWWVLISEESRPSKQAAARRARTGSAEGRESRVKSREPEPRTRD